MNITAQKYVVAALSLVLFGALVVVGRVESRLRAAAGTSAEALASGPLDPGLDRGRQVYDKFSCNACHGPAGAGGINNFNAQTGQMVNGLRLVAESYTREELVKKILDGVPVVPKLDPNGPSPPLTMPSYRGSIGDEEMELLVDYLIALQPKDKPQEKW